ncbi:unnamed protein product [[Actinomadura] parvosata subsp. kistnae]|uniref:Uncharacterized protein n=1 Tax=[Actinomadura] parvosata subsp. kistnae TaxID=1909395 RepID=A0A1V0AGN3_9ACTN|nr:hypothetical protein [Nonomuraea sp. ATCC 55076]AQZ69391.1 hypothetical protein BKM31_55060 [Nonomuraea sp. ATCC 55076]SPL91970.1 unnamed protein product [Actinomadura parvosata subsp. kistnae]
MTPPRRLAVAAATLTLAAFTTACGAIGQAVDCNTAASDATKIATEFSSSMTADAGAMETAAKTASDKTKELAGKYDGEVAAALNDLADAYSSIKPGDAASLTEFSTKINGFTSKITAACS